VREARLSRENQAAAVGQAVRAGSTSRFLCSSWLQFRLMVLATAWTIDKYNDYRKVRKDISRGV